jgi:hypothetical protein
MIIEALARWTELKAPKTDDAESYIQRLTNPDAEGPQGPQLQIHYEYSPIVFDLRDVRRFNRANDPNFTTIRFKDGDSNVIKYAYEDFVKLYSELTGFVINSIVPESASSPTKEQLDEDLGGDDLDFQDGTDEFRDI